MKSRKLLITFVSLLIVCLHPCASIAQDNNQPIKVIAFYTAREDSAHISFVHEANKWFPLQAAANHFTYDSTNDWRNLNAGFLSKYQVVIFLDTRPEDPDQRKAFEEYMKKGGGWVGLSFCRLCTKPFCLSPKTGIGITTNFWALDLT